MGRLKRKKNPNNKNNNKTTTFHPLSIFLSNTGESTIFNFYSWLESHPEIEATSQAKCLEES